VHAAVVAGHAEIEVEEAIDRTRQRIHARHVRNEGILAEVARSETLRVSHVHQAVAIVVGAIAAGEQLAIAGNGHAGRQGAGRVSRSVNAEGVLVRGGIGIFHFRMLIRRIRSCIFTARIAIHARGDPIAVLANRTAVGMADRHAAVVHLVCARIAGVLGTRRSPIVRGLEAERRFRGTIGCDDGIRAGLGCSIGQERGFVPAVGWSGGVRRGFLYGRIGVDGAPARE